MSMSNKKLFGKCVVTELVVFCIVSAKYFVSCEEAKILNPLLPNLNMMIDIDDSGPFDPFQVNCVFQGKLFLSFIITNFLRVQNRTYSRNS